VQFCVVHGSSILGPNTQNLSACLERRVSTFEDVVGRLADCHSSAFDEEDLLEIARELDA